MFIIKNKIIFLTISAIIVGLSMLSIIVFGLKFGIDFKGGALMEVTYTGDRPTVTEISEVIQPLNLGTPLVQESGTDGYIIKTRDLTEAERVSVLDALSFNKTKEVVQNNFNSIGPSVGTELKRKAIIAILAVIIAIVLFIAYAFRKVSQPISSWKYGLVAVVTLVHDIAIPSGVFAVLGHYFGAEVDTLFVLALLTILGLSVSDTIVVFDRIRENLKLHTATTFADTVGKSLNQTFTRSINTSLTVILVLLALFFFGPSTTKNFALVLVVGMFFGTYSSIFVASPILVMVEGWQKNKQVNKKKK